MSLPITSPRTSGTFTLLATREYFDQLVAEVDATKKGDRVLLATMAFEPTPPILAKLIASLIAASDRGVTVDFFSDAYNFIVNRGKKMGPLWWNATMPPTLHGEFKELYSILENMKAHNIHVTMTNPPSRRYTSPFSGRSHIKASIINDVVYLGGCNIEQQHMDCMARWEDPKAAQWLYDLLLTRHKNPQTIAAFGPHDITHALDEKTDILVDVGVRNQSAIYEQALATIDAAKDWLIISCQFFPNSITAKHLRAAHDRGVRVFPIFNHYSAHSKPKNILQHMVTSRERLRMPDSFFVHELTRGSTYLHAKVIATESEAIIGSHNYVTAGVNFGTAEIALHKKDSDFSRAAAQLLLAETGLANQPEFAFLG